MKKILLICLFIFSGVANALPAPYFSPPCLDPYFNGKVIRKDWGVGQQLYNLYLQYPQIGTAIMGAISAWDVTDAVGRIGTYNGMIYQDYMLPVYNNSVIATEHLGANSGNLAVTYNRNSYRQININIDLSWYIGIGTQLAGQPDLQAALTHEFGHWLGSSHEGAGACEIKGYGGLSYTCAQADAVFGVNHRGVAGSMNESGIVTPGSPETMTYNMGGTCQRVLSINDINSMNLIY